MQAVILAAGQGLRLRPFTEHSPKALVPVNNQALIFHTLQSLPDSISEIIIVVGYLGQQIVDQVGTSYNTIPIRYCWQNELLGTGDALLQAKDVLRDSFLVLNGDDLYNKQDLTALISHPWAMLAWQSTTQSEFGLQVKDQVLIGFEENSSLLNCGAYVLQKSFFDKPLAEITVHNKTEYSLPHTLVAMAADTTITALTARFWLPIGTPEQLAFANAYLSRKQ